MIILDSVSKNCNSNQLLWNGWTLLDPNGNNYVLITSLDQFVSRLHLQKFALFTCMTV